MKAYIYIFLRKDLSNEQKVVQASHIAYNVAKETNLGYHPSVIILKVNNEEKLKVIYEKFKFKNPSVFYEPILNNSLTGIGLLASTDEDRDLFKKYQCLKNKDFYSEVTDIRCSHNQSKLDLVETLAFEFTPARVCSKCGFILKNSYNLTEQEKKQAVRFFYNYLLKKGDNLSEEFINERKDGFNS